MKKKVLQVTVAVAFMVLMFSFGVSAKGDFAYKYSGKAYDASIEYLNEFYLKKHPDFALRNSYSAPNDWEYLEKALVPIIKGCKTDREKADAIALWVNENIKYDTKTNFTFPKDIYVSRKGDCLGDSYLIQQFLRMCDIPAVVCVGWRGNLVSVIDKEFIDSGADSRHAWTMTYIDGQWVLYDILFDIYAEKDRDFITKWYFFESLEGVSPYYGEDAISWHFGGSGCFYRNGRFYCYYNGKPYTDVSVIWNDYFHQMNCRAFDGQLSYLDKSKVNPERYEAFTDGFIQYFGLEYPMFYAQYNGIMPTGTVNEIDGTYYLFAQNGDVLYAVNHIDEYYMICNALYIADGEKLPVFPTYSDGLYNDPIEPLKIRYETANPEQLYIDEDGRVHLKEGWDKADTAIIIDLVNESGNTKHGYVFTAIVLSDEYKHSEDNDYHTYKTVSCTPATFNKPGQMQKKCTGCTKELSYEIPAIKNVKMEQTKYAYTGKEIKPSVTVTDTEGRKLIYGIDYTITCKNIKKAGVGTITIKFEGNYSGEVSKKFKITAEKAHTHTFVSSVVKKPTYTAKGKKLNVCECGYSYTSSVARKKLRKVTGLKVKSVTTSEIKLSWKKVLGAEKYNVYYSTDGKKWKKLTAEKNSVTVKKLKSGSSYRFKVKAVTGKYAGKYSSILKTATKVSAPAIKSLKSVKTKTATLVWAPVSGANGYQVKYSTSKKFTKKTTKSVTVKKQKTKKVTLKKLKKGKKYYIKLRAYKTVNGKKIYGSYSKVKSVKVK